MRRRTIAVGIGLAAATFAMAGCAGTTGTGAPTTPPSSAAPQLTPKEALVEALQKLEKQSMKAEQSLEGMVAMTSTAATDPVGKKIQATMKMGLSGVEMTVEIRAVNSEVWVKMSGVPGMPDKWMHVAADKIKKGSSLDPEKFGGGKLSTAVVDVQRDGANGFKGTIDMTTMGTMNAQSLQAMGDKAKAIPFTVTLDSQGRVSELTMDMNSVVTGMGTMKTKYSGYGDPVDVTPPAASDVVEMPAELLAAMNAA